MNLTQIAKIKIIANLIDPMAFMIVLSANEVMGRGFTLPRDKIDKMIKDRKEKEHLAAFIKK